MKPEAITIKIDMAEASRQLTEIAEEAGRLYLEWSKKPPEEQKEELEMLIRKHALDDCVLISNHAEVKLCDGCAKRCGGELEVIEGMKHDGATVLKISQVTLEAIVEHACGLRVVIDDTMHDGQMVVE